ncbi:nudix domain-containing protein [Colletotrichum musicola]|uniref:Nudix domain-containing protein n=1 Tax=Colletotrichum musicola TaxID=2175873 RepID=A0A8H6J062_9PEZI|nr:nudix domain-containing protein [Colletotrichum musicola]
MTAACEANPQRNGSRSPRDPQKKPSRRSQQPPRIQRHSPHRPAKATVPSSSQRSRKDTGEDAPRHRPALNARRKRDLAAEALPLLVATRATPSPRDRGYLSARTLKMVFWFASRVSEGQAPDEVEQVPWDANARLEWVDAK